MTAASIARGLTGPPRAVKLDSVVSVSASEPGRAGDPPANIAGPEGASSSKQLGDSDA